MHEVLLRRRGKVVHCKRYNGENKRKRGVLKSSFTEEDVAFGGGVGGGAPNEENNEEADDDEDDEEIQNLEDDVEIVFDNQGSIVIPKTRYTCDESEEMAKLMGKKKGRESVCENLFSLLCIIAFDGVSQAETVKTADLCIRVAQCMEDAFNNFPLKQEAIKGAFALPSHLSYFDKIE